MSTIVSIIIPTHGLHQYTSQCLESIASSTRVGYEILLVDSSKDDLTSDLATRWGAKLIKTDRRTFAEKNNLGYSVARGDVICMANNDVVFSRGWDDTVAALENENIGAVGMLNNCVPIIDPRNGNYINKNWEHSQKFYSSDFNAFAGFYPSGLDVFSSEISTGGLEIIKSPPFHVAGFMCMFRKNVIKKIGGQFMDDRFVNDGEDWDFCIRLVERGFDLAINNGAYIHHYKNSTFRLMGVDFHSANRTLYNKSLLLKLHPQYFSEYFSNHTPSKFDAVFNTDPNSSPSMMRFVDSGMVKNKEIDWDFVNSISVSRGDLLKEFYKCA